MPPTDIILLDIPSTLDSPISAHGWKVRMILNYKSLNFKTQFVLTCQIEATCKSLGILPTGVRPNGCPHYTLPAIIDRTDPAHPVFLADSIPIIEYLEKTYPSEERTVFPPGTRALQVLANQFAVMQLTYCVPLVAMNAHLASKVEEDRADFRQRMEIAFKVPFDKIEKTGAERDAAWAEMERILKAFGDSIDKNDEGQFLTGKTVACADFALVGCMVCLRWLSPSDAFAKLRSWHGGRWGRYFDAFIPWMALDNPRQ